MTRYIITLEVEALNIAHAASHLLYTEDGNPQDTIKSISIDPVMKAE